MVLPTGGGVAVGPPVGVGVLVGGLAASEVSGAVPTMRASRKSIGKTLIIVTANFFIIVLLLSIVFLHVDEKPVLRVVRWSS
jgi:preprotein translocase subunit SecG